MTGDSARREARNPSQVERYSTSSDDRQGRESIVGGEPPDTAAIEGEVEALALALADVHEIVDRIVVPGMVAKSERSQRVGHITHVAREIAGAWQREVRPRQALLPEVRGLVSQGLADQQALEQRAGDEDADDGRHADEGGLQQEGPAEPCADAVDRSRYLSS